MPSTNTSCLFIRYSFSSLGYNYYLSVFDVIHQFRQLTIKQKHLYSRVPSLRSLLHFRTSDTTTNSSDSLINRWTLSVMLGSPTFMRYLRVARNIILLRVSVGLHIAISSTNIAGLVNSGSLTDTTCVTKPNWCSLQHRLAWASQSSFPNSASGGLQPERQIGL